AGLESRHIGRIDIHDDHSLLDLPAGMPAEILAHLQKTWVVGRQLRIQRWGGRIGEEGGARRFPRPGPGRTLRPHRKGRPRPHG
ncbi:DbpA RNA binding domain-containing protein, partial [Klebsiella pneumoniae]|nr:DbpA RNA binding domain-containing protein [Klebsiella pneumoniae]